MYIENNGSDNDTRTSEHSGDDMIASCHDGLTASEANDLRSALNRLKVESPNVDQTWALMSERLGIGGNADAHQHQHSSWRWLFYVAASVVFCLVLAEWWFHDTRRTVLTGKPDEPVLLTASDGSQSEVEGDSVDFSHSGSESFSTALSQNISEDESSTKVTLRMPRGRNCRVVLPDGSAVWLNADSKLTFPRRFSGHQRRVELEGEGYFEVVHNEACPFVVSTEKFVAVDRGTSFNVKAYPGGESSLVLVSGSVDVSRSDGSGLRKLTPDHKIAFRGDDVQLTAVDTYPYIQWKDGFFYFHHVPLVDVMRDLGRWYNKTVVFESEESERTLVHFVAERRETLASVVASLNKIDGVHVVLSDEELTVK